MGRAWRVLGVVLLLLAVLRVGQLKAEFAGEDERMLLIVGDVSDATARVLYEGLGGEESARPLTAQLFEEPAHASVHNFSVLATRVPQILKLDGLKENTRYSVHFDNDDWVSFRTFPSRQSRVKRELKMVALSCDRYFEDKDDEMWTLLNQKEALDVNNTNTGELDLIIHMGDQIYADDVLARWREKLSNRTATTETEADQDQQDYEQLVEDYRNVYRITFGQPEAQKAMRHAANWMLLDDHDVFNNLDFDYLKRDPSVAIAFKAGMQAYHEYQGQLMADMPEDTGSVHRVDFVREVMNVAFVHLDLRHYRSYFSDAVHPMTGDAQFVDFERRIKEYGTRDDISHIFVLSPVPLMFLTPLMASIAYLAEKEIYPTYSLFLNDTLELFDMMLPYHQKIKLVSGDIHQFVLGDICHSSGACIPQMVASGITKGSAVIDSLKLWFFYMAFRHIAPKGVGDWTIKTDQQVLMRNYGVVQVDGASYWWRGVFPADIPQRHQVQTFIFDHLHIFIQIVGALFLAQLFAFILARAFNKALPPTPAPCGSMYLACVLLGVCLLVALVLTWLYGIRLYDVMSRRGHPRDQHPLFHTGRADRVVALTIDDAPWKYQLPLGVELSTSIEEIGEVLRNHDCSATLMVIGSYLRSAPTRALEAMRQLHADGIVEFANHGYTNSRAASLNAHQLAEEIIETEAAVRDWLGPEARMAPYYRPGCGRFHADMLRVAADRGYRTVLGDAYPFDPQLPVPFLLFWHLMTTVRPGGIIILHDRPWTPALLRMLLPWLQDQGYRVVMLSRALPR